MIKYIKLLVVSVVFLVGASLVSAQSSINPEALPVINNVTAEPKIFSEGDSIEFSFKVDQPVKTLVNIYDARGYLVWSKPIGTGNGLISGEQKITWNGKAKGNKSLVPEAYYYTISATNQQGKTSVYDLTDITGGERIHAQDIQFNAEQKKVTYMLPSNARFFLRYGVDQGPMMGTLVNSAVQAFGQHSVPWDGKDQSEQFELSKLGQVKFGISGYTLPRNALIYQTKDKTLTTKATNWAEIPADKSTQRFVKPDRSRNVHIHRFQNRESSKDFAIKLTAKSGKESQNGLVIAGPSSKFRVDIAPEDKQIVEAQRFEVSFFIDNKLVHENEVSYVPYTWHLPELDLEQGEHILTALVVGFGSHFGVASTKFVVD